MFPWSSRIFIFLNMVLDFPLCHFLKYLYLNSFQNRVLRRKFPGSSFPYKKKTFLQFMIFLTMIPIMPMAKN